MDKKPIYFTPVFVEPTIKHSLLNVYRYTYIILFELAVIALLIFLFFKTEFNMLLRNTVDLANDPIKQFTSTSLMCKGNALFIKHMPNSTELKPALAINRKQIVHENCAALLQSINGSRKVSLNDILERR
ncbi:m59R [Myxoma virus]|nr:m59R [Myxoma virus]